MTAFTIALQDKDREIAALTAEVARLKVALASRDAALGAVIAITEETHTGQERAYTALSRIGGVAREERR